MDESLAQRLDGLVLTDLGDKPVRSRRSSNNAVQDRKNSLTSSTSGSPSSSAEELFKTELCRSFDTTGACKYGAKCRFAHGQHELRPVARHPKYKTQHCKTFCEQGHCPYGARCKFIHADRSDDSAASAPGQLEHTHGMSAMQMQMPHQQQQQQFQRPHMLRDRRSQSVDSAVASGKSNNTNSEDSSLGNTSSGNYSPMGQMSPFQDLSPRSPEVHRRSSPRGLIRGHASLVVTRDDEGVRFVKKETKDRLPIFKVLAGDDN
jgi:butyrate response factor 1